MQDFVKYVVLSAISMVVQVLILKVTVDLMGGYCDFAGALLVMGIVWTVLIIGAMGVTKFGGFPLSRLQLQLLGASAVTELTSIITGVYMTSITSADVSLAYLVGIGIALGISYIYEKTIYVHFLPPK